MKTVNVSELEGAALDWAVASAIGQEVISRPVFGLMTPDTMGWRPSTDWSQGGPLIEAQGVWLSDDNEAEEQWIASIGGVNMQYGETPLIAACRATVAAKLGDTIEVPEELL